MKKFVVEIDRISDKFGVEDLLLMINSFDLRIDQGSDVKVTELKPLPEVRKIETGILMSPAEICKCDYVDTITWIHKGESMQLCKDSTDIGKRLNVYTSFYPHVFYKDIRTEWDFSSIPVGSLIRIDGCTDVWDIGIVEKISGDEIKLRSGSQGAIEWSSDNIKNIRIIETKDGE